MPEAGKGELFGEPIPVASLGGVLVELGQGGIDMRLALACLVVGGLTGSVLAGEVDDRGHNEIVVDIPSGTVGGQLGDPLNTVITLSGGDIQEYVQISAIGWDFGLLMVDPWWFSDVRVRVSNDSGDQYVFAPGAGDDFGGINSYSSNGLMSLVDLGEAFYVGADHSISIEFFNPNETNGGIFGDVDALILGGSMTIGTRVPAPGVLGLFATVGVLASRRRR